MAKIHTVVKGAGKFTIGKIVALLFGFATSVLIARFLGPGDYGYLSLGLAFIFVLVKVSGLGLNETMAFFIPKTLARKKPGETKYVFKFSLVLRIISSLIISGVLFLTSDIIANSYSIPILSPILKALSVGLLFLSMYSFFVSVCQGFQQLKFIMYQDIAYGLLKFIPLIAFFLGLGLIGIAFSYSIVYIALAIIGFIIVYTKLIPKVKTEKYSKRKILSYASFAFSTGILFLFFTQIIQLILGYYWGQQPEQLGFYATALILGGIILIIPDALSMAFYPAVSEFTELKKHKKLGHLFSKVTKYVFLLALPSSIGLAVLAKSAIYFVYGAEYLPGSLTLSVIAIGSAIFAIMSFYTTFSSGIGKIEYPAIVGVIQAIASLLLCFLLIPKYGALGAGFVFLAVQIVGLVVLYNMIRKHYAFTLPLKELFLITLSGIFMGLSIWLVQRFVTFKFDLILHIALGALVYALLVFKLGLFDKEDKKMIRAALAKIGIRQ